ncbi:MutS-related protein [Photobacterium minamisatsumaniensis]|uniref:MutS-related protein n=1 Tax=Photobacterium minamisatsumaniensis TaxID=2910233 RepID=UPI003D0FAC62
MMGRNVRGLYLSRIKRFSQELNDKNKRIAIISYFRLFIFLVMSSSFYFGYKSHDGISVYTVTVISLFIFILLIVVHSRLFKRIAQLKRLILINENGVKRMDDEWRTFEDTGADFIDDAHPFSYDLDVFGKSSIFQYINTTYTFLGRQKLAAKLCDGSTDIANSQKAVDELSGMIDFRQNIELKTANITNKSPNDFIDWLEIKTVNIVGSHVAKVIRILPVISLLVLLLDLLVFHTVVVPLFFYTIQSIIYLYYKKKTIAYFSDVNGIVRLFLAYSNVLGLIESVDFNSALLKREKEKLFVEDLSASQRMLQLSQISQKSDLRYNQMLHFFINLFFMWDLNCYISARNWKVSYGQYVRTWLDVVSEFEALSSLAVLRFEHSDWAMPAVNSSECITANNVKHPLIHYKKSIGNDFSLKKTNKVSIISGSNMSGKSTFLRTIATNLLLAYAGAPVYADGFICGHFSIVTSMRKRDNLSDNISTFYAELLRIKLLLDKSELNKTFFVIDEIFSGTNSIDRIDAATMILNQLSIKKCCGMVSTHDLELCTYATHHPEHFANFHFREHYVNKHIKFDYKIYSGQSETRNAMHIMKMIGINVTP